MIGEALEASLNDVMTRRLRQPKQQAAAVSAIMMGFSALRMKPVPDLAERVKKTEAQVKVMVQNIGIKFQRDKFVVTVAGSSEALMNQLRRGSDWYEPWDKVDELVLAAVLVDPPK